MAKENTISGKDPNNNFLRDQWHLFKRRGADIGTLFTHAAMIRSISKEAKNDDLDSVPFSPEKYDALLALFTVIAGKNNLRDAARWYKKPVETIQSSIIRSGRKDTTMPGVTAWQTDMEVHGKPVIIDTYAGPATHLIDRPASSQHSAIVSSVTLKTVRDSVANQDAYVAWAQDFTTRSRFTNPAITLQYISEGGYRTPAHIRLAIERQGKVLSLPQPIDDMYDLVASAPLIFLAQHELQHRK